MRAVAVAIAVAASARVAAADPTGGVDAVLVRPAYDANGLYALEGARPMEERDIAFQVVAGYAHSPIRVAVPGIGAGPGDTAKDRILDDLGTLDLVFGMAVTSRFTIGIDAAAYRTTTGAGYGVRGRYANGAVTKPSTGLVSLRPLSNIDPSATGASSLDDELAGPLDARVGAKYALVVTDALAIAAIVSMSLPFGADDMLLGDESLMFEPKLAAEWRIGGATGTGSRILANVAARIRQRTVLQAYDVQDPAATEDDAKAFLDVGSELVAGLGGELALGERARLGAEVHAFLPLPASMSWGDCRLFDGERCTTLTAADYFAGAKRGDATALATVGLRVRVTPDVSLGAMVGAGAGGARADQLFVGTSLTWAPRPVVVPLSATTGDEEPLE